MALRHWLETIVAQFCRTPLRPDSVRRRLPVAVATQVESLETLTLLSMVMASNDSASGVHNQPIVIDVLQNDMAMMDPMTMEMPGPLSAVLENGPSHGTLTANGSGGFTYVANANWAGVDSFTYHAKDGASVSSTATVSVMAMNSAPTANGHSYSTKHDHSVSGSLLDGAYDSDGDSMTGILVQGPSHGSVSVNSNGTFTYTPTQGFAGADTFSYKVSDGISDSQTVYIGLDVTNQVPQAYGGSYNATNTQPLVVSAPGVLGGASDADGDALTATLFMGPMHGTLSLNQNGSFTYTAQSGYVGMDMFSFSASDGIASSGTATVMLNVVQGVQPPSVTAPGNQANPEHSTVSVAVSATDPGGYSLTYSASGLPSGLGISSTTGVISGTIAYGTTASGPYTVSVTATNSQGLSDSKSFTWTVTALPPNITAPAGQTNHEHDGVTLAVVATDPAGYGLTFSAAGLPGGLHIDSMTGEIHGTVDYRTMTHDPYVVSVTVTNTFNKSASASFNWTIQALPPTLDSINSRYGDEGTVVSTFSIADYAHDPAQYALIYTAAGLPPGLSINTTSGAISGTIAYRTTLGQPYHVTVTVDNQHGGTASKSFDWTTTAATPVFPELADQDDPEQSDVNVAAAATDPAGYALTYVVSGLPDGLDIDQSTGEISGKIDYGTRPDSIYTVTVTATNEHQASASKSFHWTVDALKPDITVGDKTNVEQDQVSFFLNGTDPAGYDLTYRVTGLPGGLTINSATGKISGQIRKQAAAHGPYTVTATVENEWGLTDSDTFTWTITTAAPEITTPADQSSSEQQTVNLAVSATDPAGYPLTFSAAGLPGGLTINATTGAIFGTIASGAATAVPDGEYDVEVTVSKGSCGSFAVEHDGKIYQNVFLRQPPAGVACNAGPNRDCLPRCGSGCCSV